MKRNILNLALPALVLLAGSSPAQPMPPMPSPVLVEALTNNAYLNNNAYPPKRKAFTVSCPHCRGKFHLPALGISTNGSRSVAGGVIVERTITFACPSVNCREKFTAKNEKFVPETIAIEDDPEAPALAPALSGSIQSWTTNPNLRLTIKLTNCPTPIPWPASVSIPSGAGTFHSWYSNGVQVTTNSNQFVWTTNSLGVICGPAVVIKYPTEIGKVYKCQATDDAKQTWIDGTPVVGTGMPVVQYEAAIKTNRIYRVLEQPL